MSGILITIDSSTSGSPTTNDITINFNSPISVRDGNYEIALIKTNLWYSFYNIAASFGNNTLKYTNATAQTRTVTFEDGNYTLIQINDTLHYYMQQNGDYSVVNGVNVYNINIVPDYSTLKVDIEISGGYSLDLTVSTLNQLLGWNQGVYNATGTGSAVANINRGVNSILIRCSIVNSTYQNGSISDILYSFVPNVPPGSNIEVTQKPELIYLPINQTDFVRSIRIYMTDQLGRPINLNNEPTTHLLYLRKKLKQPLLIENL